MISFRLFIFSKNSTEVMCPSHCITSRMILIYSIIGDFNFHLLVKGVSNRFLYQRVTLHSISNYLIYGKTFWYYINVLFPMKPLPTSFSIHWYFLPNYHGCKIVIFYLYHFYCIYESAFLQKCLPSNLVYLFIYLIFHLLICITMVSFIIFFQKIFFQF